MAFLLRLRTTHTSPSPSLLHHHRHLLPTSNSGSGDHLNSPHPSPSLLRELREAIEQLSAREYVFATPFINDLYPLPPPASATIPFIPPSSTFPSPPFLQLQTRRSSAKCVLPTIDNKLEQLRVSALSLRHRQDTDRQRIWEMDQSRIAFSIKVHAELEEHIKLGNENDNGTLVEG